MSYPAIPTRRGHFWTGALVIFVGGLVLGFIPIIGPFIAGVVGGKIVGNTKGALLAALIPAIVVGFVAILGALAWGPFAAIAGLFAVVLYIFHILALLAGAALGGAL